MSLDLVEVIKVVEDVVFEDGVELVLNARDDRILLVDVQTQIVERLLPVELVKVEELEIV